jgi:hypothetical protein
MSFFHNMVRLFCESENHNRCEVPFWRTKSPHHHTASLTVSLLFARNSFIMSAPLVHHILTFGFFFAGFPAWLS